MKVAFDKEDEAEQQGCQGEKEPGGAPTHGAVKIVKPLNR
jgi:hypothetical protein